MKTAMIAIATASAYWTATAVWGVIGWLCACAACVAAWAVTVAVTGKEG